MIIGIDAHNIRGNGGSLIHLKELLENSSPEKHKFEKLIIWVNSEINKKLPQKSFIEYIVLPNRNSILSLIWQKFNLKIEAEKKKCNVLFFPGGIYLGSFKPFIAFSQSMLPFDYETRNIYRATLQYWVLVIKEYLMRHSFRKANAVIFVSNAIKKQVEKVGKHRFIKSNVIHHGVSEIFNNNVERPSFQELQNNGLPIKILTVSSHAKHKNLLVLVKAISEIKNEGIDIELKIIGPETKYGTEELLKEVNKLDPEKSFINVISDAEYEDLPKFYKDSDVFIITSLCESFGLPLKEAIASNIPILYQSIDSFNEIIKSITDKPMCVVFDSSIENLKNKLLEILNKENLKSYLLDETESDFGWEKCTRETFSYLRNIIS